MTDQKYENMLRHVQTLATGVLIEWLLAAHFHRAKYPDTAADDMLTLAENLSSQMTFPEAGPEWSDLAAQEFRDTLIRHIYRAKSLATGEPFDPIAFHRRVPDSD